ncbi:hypothetical protein M758_12G119500 [Ceratodon purpureus]|nr:hypothetical protein M758_12G119500 [Ceratodon purpureus]
MASMQRLDATNLSSPDGGLHNAGGASHRSFGAGLEKSHSFRESHEGRASGGGGPSTSHGEGLPLTSVLFLDSIGLPSAKSTAQVELRRAMNAASGQGGDDPSLGNIQSKALENCSAEEIKRMRTGLMESVHRARERGRHLSEAVIKVDRYQNSMQSRKRNRTDGGGHDRGSHGGPGQRGGGAALAHVTKGGGRGASSSGEGSGSGTQKGPDKNKSGVISKRMRTSLADARPEGRPSNLSVQRSSGVQERERESPRPGGLGSLAAEEKERGGVGGSEGWEKSKMMKGRRSATIKPDAPVVSSANGVADGEREQKGGGLVQRGGGDGRSRPSEGHGFRSGPVHGSVSVQKAESAALANGSGIRGGSKAEGGDGAAQVVGKAERGGLAERERSNGKGGAKPVGRDEGRPASPGIVPKAKGARAPRSNLVAGGNQSAQMGRSSPFGDVREKASVTSPAKPQVPSGPTNRKRAAPSRSSSPPVASWGSSRPQKMARARRVNVMPPVSISVPARDEANGVEEAGPGLREGSGPVATPSSRPSLGGGGGGGSSAKRGGGQGVPPAKAERSMASVGPVESEEYMEEGQKMKGRRKKQEDEDGEQRVSGASERSGSVAVATSRGGVLGGGEESGGGDGVRRQGRTGRGPVTARVAAVSCALEKAEVATPNVKPTRIGRATETKSAGAGRPGTKNGGSDRKISSRPRRLLGNSGAEILGEEEDDHEQLSRAVQQVVEFSALACPNSFWKQMEPYFGYVTSDDLSYLQRHMALVGEMGTITGVKSPITGDRVLDSDEAKNVNNPREQSTKERSFRRGRSGGWYDKVFPLSQRLLSALISEREDEAHADRDSESPAPPSSHSEMDYDRRDAEGESDVDNLKPESEWWSAGGMEGGYSEGSPGCGGQGNREEQGGDDILAGYDGHQVEWGYGVEGDGRDDEAGSGRQLENGSMDWDEQYRRMSVDDRLLVELSSVGLLPVQPREHNEQEVDDIGEEIRRLQAELDEQVVRNKEHLCRLESAVVERRLTEERAREKLAMDKLVELAYKKKTGGRSNKGAAAKGARAAALAFAKRVLARVHNYEAGHGCITDPALRDRLLCVPPSLVESTPDAAMDAVKDAGAVATTAERLTSPKGGGGAMLMGIPGGQRLEEIERASFVGQSAGIDLSHLKDEGWPSRELSLEDVSRYTSTRDVNALSSIGLGGIKGKRSERDRDAKVKEGGGAGRSGPSNAKGERKTKTKPRQKTGPLLKPIQGLVPKAAEEQAAKPGRGVNQGHGHGGYFGVPERRDESAMPGLPMLAEPQMEAEGHIDLSAIPLPGMEMMNSMEQGDDIGSWLDFGLDDPMQQTDDLSMGLDVPMDDLSGLMMM